MKEAMRLSIGMIMLFDSAKIFFNNE